MKHSFDVQIASEFGVEEAIIIDNLFFWINKNIANKKHKYEGRFWTYNTIEAFSELFPYMSYSQISRRINVLVEKGILIKGNFNQSSYDRTLWYAFSNNGISILQKNGYHFSNLQNGVSENEDSIPDSKTANKQDKKTLYNTEVDMVYYLYPTECYVKGSSTGKTLKNKEKIRSIIKEKGFDWLRDRVENYLVNCKLNKTYLKNFGTFLNNIPEPVQTKASPVNKYKISM